MTNLHEIPWLSLVILLFCLAGSSRSLWHEDKHSHRPTELDEATYKALALGSNQVSFESILQPLLVPRVPGTENHVEVRKYLIDYMKNLGWNVDTDAFEDTTPQGVKPFENIIATLNPDVHSRLVLACHFDSKYTKGYAFIGAIDSAVPCAQLLHLATTMQGLLNKHKNSAQNVTLQFIFFDGEEAFNFWSDTDSLYGSRHLAAKWQGTLYPPGNKDRTTELNRMDLMVLLDLLGTANVKLNPYFVETSHWYQILVQSEQQLKKSNYWSGRNRREIFQSRRISGGIQDDHIPFLQRGVNILHLIPSQFPSVWHTERDNKNALDFDTIDNLNKVFRMFVVRYLHINPGPVKNSAS